MDIRFVHPAQFGQSQVGLALFELDARRRQGDVQGRQCFRWQAIRVRLVRAKDMTSFAPGSQVCR